MGKPDRKERGVTFNLLFRSHADPSNVEEGNAREWVDTREVTRKRVKRQQDAGITFDDDYDYMQHVKYRFANEDMEMEEMGNKWDNVEAGQFDDAMSRISGRSRRTMKSSASSVIFGGSEFPSIKGRTMVVQNDDDYNTMASISREKPDAKWDPEVAAAMNDDFDDFGEELEDNFVELAGGLDVMEDEEQEEFDMDDWSDVDEDEEEDEDVEEEEEEEKEDSDEELAREIFEDFESGAVISAKDQKRKFKEQWHNAEQIDWEKAFAKQGSRANDWGDVLKDLGKFEENVAVAKDLEQEVIRMKMEASFKSKESRLSKYSVGSSCTVARSMSQRKMDKKFESVISDYEELEIGALDLHDVKAALENFESKKVFNPDKEVSMEAFHKGLGNFTGKEHRPLRTIKELKISEYTDDESVKSEELFPATPPKQEHDCESILSTYSNIYNRPKMIVSEKKVKLNAAGFPILDDEKSTKSKTETSVDFDQLERMKWIPPNVRRRDETKEETKARVKIQKEEQRIRRMEKKGNKIAFKQEELRLKREDMNKKKTQSVKVQ